MSSSTVTFSSSNSLIITFVSSSLCFILYPAGLKLSNKPKSSYSNSTSFFCYSSHSAFFVFFGFFVIIFIYINFEFFSLYISIVIFFLIIFLLFKTRTLFLFFLFFSQLIQFLFFLINSFIIVRFIIWFAWFVFTIGILIIVRIIWWISRFLITLLFRIRVTRWRVIIIFFIFTLTFLVWRIRWGRRIWWAITWISIILFF